MELNIIMRIEGEPIIIRVVDSAKRRGENGDPRGPSIRDVLMRAPSDKPTTSLDHPPHSLRAKIVTAAQTFHNLVKRSR